jgi:predicted ester cyclase/ketosteroid isomerase-like protein
MKAIMLKVGRTVSVFLLTIFSLTTVAADSDVRLQDIQPVAQSAKKSASTKGHFEKLLNKYQHRLANNDVNGILELYSSDPVFIPEYAPPAVGREAVRKAYAWVFATLKLEGHFIVHEAKVIGDTAWVRTNSTGRFTVIATGAAGDVANSEFFLFKRESGAWKIHRYIFTASAPAPQANGRSEMSDIEANKAIVRRYFETFNAGDFGRLDEIVSQDYGDRLEGQTAGIKVIKDYLQGLKSSFPDFTWTIQQIIAEGDRVAVLNRVTGTHLHDFGEMKATGNRVDFQAFQIYRIADGKLAEHWEVADFTKFQEQLSAEPKDSAFKKFQEKLRD